MITETPLYKHIYQVFFDDKTSIKVIAFDEPDAKVMAEKLKPKKTIKKIKKIAD